MSYQDQVLDYLREIQAAVYGATAALADLAHQLKRNMITAQTVTSLVNAINTLITADQSDRSALASAQQAVTDLTQQVADLNDPNLQASVDSALANAAAATPPPTPVPVPPDTGGGTTPPAQTRGR